MTYMERYKHIPIKKHTQMQGLEVNDIQVKEHIVTHTETQGNIKKHTETTMTIQKQMQAYRNIKKHRATKLKRLKYKDIQRHTHIQETMRTYRK